jgi:hypothetical protein
VKTSRKVVPALVSMKTTCVSFLMGPHRNRITVSFRVPDTFRVAYTSVSSSLLDQESVEL